MTQRMRTALDFGPLLAYLVAFYATGKDVYISTGVVMVASVISLGIYYVQTRKIAPIPAFTCFIMLTFGSMTLLPIEMASSIIPAVSASERNDA